MAVWISLLIALTSVGQSSASAQGRILTAPFKGAAVTPFAFSAGAGCERVSPATPTWSSSTGDLSGVVSTSASTCTPAAGTYGSDNYGFGQPGTIVELPVRVFTAGNHSISTAWTVQASSHESVAYGACSKGKVNYQPPLYQSSASYCQVGTLVAFTIQVNLLDLQNTSWSSNYSAVSANRNLGWSNYTYCANYSVAFCNNQTGAFNASNTLVYNAVGFGPSYTWGSSSNFTLWSNGTGMQPTHRYELVIQFTLSVESWAYAFNLLSHWKAKSSASINLATLGNKAALDNITLH